MFCLEIRKRGERQEENQRIQEKRTRNGQEKTDEAKLRGSAECPIIIDSD